MPPHIPAQPPPASSAMPTRAATPSTSIPIDTSSARGPLVASHASVAYSHSRRVRLHVRVISRIWAWSGFSTRGE